MVYFVADKVGFIIDKGGGINGGDLAANDILMCLRFAGHDVTVVSRRPPIEMPRRINDVSLPPVKWLVPPRYIAFPSRLDRRFIKRVAKWLIYNVQDLLLRYRFERQLQRDKPALILFNDFPHPESTVKKHLIDGKKAVLVVQMTLEGFAFFRRRDPSYTETRVLKAINAYESLIFVSEHAREEWGSLTTPKTGQTFVISNCCREDEVLRLLSQSKQAVRVQLGFSPDDYIAVCVANIQPGKGQDLLVEALPEWIGSIPNFKLLLVGTESGTWSTALHKRIAELKLEERVIFLGTRSDAMALTYAADVFVFPTRAETHSIAILEAMALRTPIAASDVGGVSESIANGEHGLLFPLNDIGRLTAAVTNLYQNQDLGQDLANRASEKYWHTFSRAQQIERYSRALDTILAA